MNAYQTSSATNARSHVLHNSIDSQTPNLNLITDGFDFWWQTTSARHVALTAEASALIRAHRRANSANQLLLRKAH
jgi:hypothetical protein